MDSTLIGKIHVLADDVSCRIAAGEVVERPASVVKELVENSLDAGSTVITIEVEEGGRRLIRVVDNGEGMNRADAQVACQRFATSKLQSESDLQTLFTFGFRGEALPSIVSISRFRLKTISKDFPIGTEVHSVGGIRWEVQDYAGAQGTQVEVRDVFFNTPGRLKFLKSVNTEFSKICYVVQQAAAVNPTTHFRLYHQDHKVLDYPPAQTAQDRLLQLYGSTFLEKFLPIRRDAEGFQVTGFTVSPHHAKTSRTPQEIFVNRRPVKNSTITHAVQEAYRSFLPKGRHPQYILFLQLDSHALDINVHPTKREVRFSHPEVIHAGVLRATKQVFVEHNAPTEDHTEQIPQPHPGHQRPPTIPPTAQSLAVTPFFRDGTSEKGSNRASSSLSLFVQEPLPTYVSQDQSYEVYPLGQIHHTYLLGHINGDLYILDQHTAHERVLFERLMRAWSKREIPQQALLIPEPVELLPHQGELLEEWLPVFTQVGLDIERFGPTTYLVRATPAALGAGATGPLVMELIEELSEWRSTDSLESLIHPILATMACQRAVQAGRTMTQPEIKELFQDWAQERFPMTCPHGRRVAVRHSLEELNTLFARPSS